MNKYKPTVKGYSSGAGGLELGLANKGLNIIQSLELDPVCCETLKLNFTHPILQIDIKEKTVLDQPKSDIMSFTFPCQRYSAISNISGTRTGEDLFLHAFRHLVLEKSPMFVCENVPGMRAFKVVMECFEKIPDYYVTVICPVDALNWLPQKRERLIIIGTRKPFHIAAPSEKRKIRLKDIIEKDVEMEIPNYFYNRLNGIGGYRDKPIISNPNDPNAYAPTCIAHYSKDVSTRAVVDKKFLQGVRPYTPREYARLQGFPDDFKFAGSNRDIYKQVGNAVAVNVGEWIGEQAMRYFN
jgi:DNA (cytosine-5)-methyltransferase 1